MQTAILPTTWESGMIGLDKDALIAMLAYRNDLVSDSVQRAIREVDNDDVLLSIRHISQTAPNWQAFLTAFLTEIRNVSAC